MPADFTYETYEALLDAGRTAGMSFLTVREYLAADSLPSGFVVLRHDVDRKPGNALDFARMEAARGVASTYYVRTVDGTYDPATVREIELYGHEVGYHYEDVDRADGDPEFAHASFEANLAHLREVADVDTVCMHGNPLSPHDNRELWAAGPDFESYGLLGEAYLSMDFADVTYFSDTGRTWRDGALKVKDHTVGEDAKAVQVDSTDELIAHLRANPEGRYCLLSHPDRWAGTVPERVVEASYDAVKNTGKRVLTGLSR